MNDDLLGQLSQLIGKPAVLDLIATVGMYTILAYIVKSCGTPIDLAVADALADAPLKP